MAESIDLDRRDFLTRTGKTGALAGLVALGGATVLSSTARAGDHSGVTLVVLYPQPTDAAAFETDYAAHLELFHAKTGIPADPVPYSVTRFVPGPDGAAPFYQMISIPFPSAEALQSAMSTPEMQDVAADAVRISTGGAPVILVGVPT